MHIYYLYIYTYCFVYIYLLYIYYTYMFVYIVLFCLYIYIYIHIYCLYILLYAFWSVPILYIWEALSAIRKRLNNRMEKYISSDTLCNLAEVVLKNNIFKFGKKNINGPAIGTKFVSRYSTVFMAEMEEEILRKAEFKPYL